MYRISTEAKQDLPYVTLLFLFHVGGEGRTYDIAPSALAEAGPQETATSIVLNSPIKEQARHNVYNWTYHIHSLRSFFLSMYYFITEPLFVILQVRARRTTEHTQRTTLRGLLWMSKILQGSGSPSLVLTLGRACASASASTRGVTMSTPTGAKNHRARPCMKPENLSPHVEQKKNACGHLNFLLSCFLLS